MGIAVGIIKNTPLSFVEAARPQVIPISTVDTNVFRFELITCVVRKKWIEINKMSSPSAWDKIAMGKENVLNNARVMK
jgi:hypothetical protein